MDYELEYGDTFEDELNNEYETEFEDELDETEFEYEAGDWETAFDDADEMELAAELLELESDAEIDHFFGGLFKKVVGHLSRDPALKPLVKTLRNTAKKALPALGRSVGRALDGSSGARIGQLLGSRTSRWLGLELEAMTEEDQEYELARRLVRLAGATAKNIGMSRGTSPKKALTDAAKRILPGLVRPRGRSGRKKKCGCKLCGRSTGRWIKSGGKIILT